MHLCSALLPTSYSQVFTIQFDPILIADVFNAVKGMFDDIVCRDVLVVSITCASSLPVDAGLQAGITSAHIWQFKLDS